VLLFKQRNVRGGAADRLGASACLDCACRQKMQFQKLGVPKTVRHSCTRTQPNVVRASGAKHEVRSLIAHFQRYHRSHTIAGGVAHMHAPQFPAQSMLLKTHGIMMTENDDLFLMHAPSPTRGMCTPPSPPPADSHVAGAHLSHIREMHSWWRALRGESLRTPPRRRR
jgi:hypothetical protein